MEPGRIVALALVTQGALMGVAWALTRALSITLSWGHPVRDALIGVLAALALAAMNYWLLARSPSNWIVDGVRAVFTDVLVPLFGRLNTASLVTIGAAAGVGEEWLFRGIVQPALGLPAASLAFGLAHVGGRRMLPFGIWATGMGLVLGTLAWATGGLVAPMVAHGIYDMLALAYIRQGAQSA